MGVKSYDPFDPPANRFGTGLDTATVSAGSAALQRLTTETSDPRMPARPMRSCLTFFHPILNVIEDEELGVTLAAAVGVMEKAPPGGAGRGLRGRADVLTFSVAA